MVLLAMARHLLWVWKCFGAIIFPCFRTCDRKSPFGKTLLASTLIGAIGCHSHTFNQAGLKSENNQPESRSKIREMFNVALNATGQVYQEAEKALLTGGTPAEEELRLNLTNTDPVARAIARTTLAMIQGRAPENAKALQMIEWAKSDFAPTILLTPPPRAVGGRLLESFADKPAEYLALQLLKQEDWPEWQTLGVLDYLKRVKSSRSVASVIRLAAETQDPKLFAEAIETIRSIGDPKTREKVGAEMQRAKKQNKRLPPELVALREKP
jgi:hypothetical protein